MENRRTDSADDNDDGDLVEDFEPTPTEEGRSGGALQEDVATRAEFERVRDPEAHESVEKQDKLDHKQESSTRHPADKTP